MRQCILQTRQTKTTTTTALPTLLSPRTRRPFHSTPRTNNNSNNNKTHYQTLSLPITATDKEIKKQFYALSKTHHPDLHPNDPTASQKFVEISEAYATLGSPEKRQKYDRDVIAPSQQQQATGGYGSRGGSYSSASSGPGGRPASGLSRRRTQFRGPPPSFYRSGGWGKHGSKRQQESEKSSHTNEAQGRAASNESGDKGSYGSAAGTGPGGFTSGFDNDVPHFDQRGHFQTQSTIERMRQKASERRRRSTVRREEDFEYESGAGNSAAFNFVLLMGVLGVIYGVSGIIFGFESRGGGKGKLKKEEGEK